MHEGTYKNIQASVCCRASEFILNMKERPAIL